MDKEVWTKEGSDREQQQPSYSTTFFPLCARLLLAGCFAATSFSHVSSYPLLSLFF